MRKRDPNRIEMGRRFREARERLNWSREVLAERADLSVSFIADLELGNTGTRLENFIRLCRLLDLNADYVLFGAPGDAVQRITDLLRDRDEEVAPERSDLVLHGALLVPRVGVGEAVVEPVVRGEAPEELGGDDLRADPAVIPLP